MINNESSISINNVLSARENRSAFRNEIAKKGYPNISLTLNIPGYPKSNEDVNTFFKTILSELKIFLIANRIDIDDEKIIIDEAGDFFLAKLISVNSDLRHIKNLTESFEKRHELGRLIDVDIFDTNNQPVSSGKQKKCLICADKTAVQCMREQNHTFEELRKVVFDRINNFNIKIRSEQISNKLSQYATKVLLYEISLTPKPGLVDFVNSGSHTDMDFQVFLNSTSALSTYWKEFAELGINYQKDLKYALPEIREIGLRAENEMFLSTGGINTQKGLVFLLGLSVFSMAYILRKENYVDETNFQKTLKSITRNIIEDELANNIENSTHGSDVFRKYGIKGAGARYQAQYGFPIVFDKILPFLSNNLSNQVLASKIETDKVLIEALLIIINNLDDTNVMYRKGIDTAEELKALAGNVLNGDKTYNELCTFCLENNISPGGAADMIAVSLFIYLVINETKK